MVCCRLIIRRQLIQFAAFRRYLVARIIDTNCKLCICKISVIPDIVLSCIHIFLYRELRTDELLIQYSSICQPDDSFTFTQILTPIFLLIRSFRSFRNRPIVLSSFWRTESSQITFLVTSTQVYSVKPGRPLPCFLMAILIVPGRNEFKSEESAEI